ncbi:hypothetical protein KKH23_06165 [Patescibacteria group bacterium]|nr:hypothetical protein [Patescibacteria group bacterium]
MALIITPEILLYISLLISNTVGKAMKNLEGKTLDEIKAMILDEQSKKSSLMAEMHSTD